MSVPNIDEELAFTTARKIESPEARSSYLDQVCGGNTALRDRVEALLRAHERDNFLMPVAGPAGPAISEGPGSGIGPYKLLEQIGEGGFGVVFMAEQQRPIRRKVALKVLKPGMDTRRVVARFEAERQALALMEHQNIARVLDAGETVSNRPYFVMELVRGTPITTFCDESHLLVRDRLQLFLDVCQGVQHAHQKGIIHRDLKPSNILVTLHDGTPVPKVIDFGIAKAVGQQLTEKTLFTGFNQMIGTPSYMSPEQAEMSGLDVDTRSDIYALGVLLYELLTGDPPCDAERVRTEALDEIRRIIREEEPALPSTRVTALGKMAGTVSANRRSDPHRLRQLYQGELDWIVMKALEKDRNRRYETAEALAADVQRYLNNEPVLACPPSTLYRMRKVVQRHRGAAAAASLALLALVVGVIAATWGWIRSVDAEAVALREANEKEAALKERESALDTAQQSERDAREQLFVSLLNQARAVRFSRKMGQRLNSLDIIARAARIRTDAQLRDEALAALAHPDLKPGARWHSLPVGFSHLHFDADYRLYARGGDQGIISVRTVADDREVQCIRTTPTVPSLLRLSPDGRYVASLARDKLRVWRVAGGGEVLFEPPVRIRGLGFSHDSRYLIGGQGDAVVRFELATGREVNRWPLPENARVWSIVFHPDNRRAAVCYDDAEVVSIYDTETGERVVDLPVGKTQRAVVAWHPDGTRLAVGTSRFIQIWDVDTRSKRVTLEGHVQQVGSLSFHPNGSLLASRSWDGVLRLLDVSTGRAVLEMPLLVDPQFSRDGRWLGALQHGEDAQLLEAITAPDYRTLGEGEGDYLEADLSPDNRLLAVNRGDLGIRIWELAHGREVETLAGGIPLFRPDGRELFVCNADGLHRRTMDFDRDLRLGPLRTIPLPATPTRVSCSRDGRTLAMVSETEKYAWLVDLDTDTVQKQRFAHVNAGYVSLSPDGNWLATSGWHSDEVRLWNARTGELAHEWKLRQRASVTFAPDSRTLVLGLGHEFRFYDISSQELVFRIRRDVAMHPGFVAFAPAAGLMALELAPGIVHLKEIETRRTVARLEDPHGDRASWLGLTPDGSRLTVVSQYSRAVHVWDLRSVRERLKSMKLDWDWPAFSPSFK